MNHELFSASSQEPPATLAETAEALPAREVEDRIFLRAASALLRAVELVQEGIKRPRALAEDAFDRIIESHTAFPDGKEERVDSLYRAIAGTATMVP